MKSEFLTPVVTILDENGRIDEKGNCAVYDHLIAGGVDGIVVMGSTGEFFALPMEEKKKLASLAVRHIAGRTRVLIGTGCMTVEETVELSNFAHGEGADGVMIVSPYYFSLSEASILEFYDRVAGAVSADIYIYNFPDRTGYDVSPAITLQLQGYRQPAGPYPRPDRDHAPGIPGFCHLLRLRREPGPCGPGRRRRLHRRAEQPGSPAVR